MPHRHWLAATVFALAAQQALAAPATVLRNESLRAQASASAAAVATVQRGAQVQVLAKKGGWVQVRAAGKTGWVRLLSVRAGAGGLGGSGAGDLVGAATTRSDPNRVVAVAGLRGLNEEDLKKAEYDAAQVELLQRFSVSTAQASTHARSGGLVAARVADLPDPAKTPTKTPASSWE